jgi:hypothetical protein
MPAHRSGGISGELKANKAVSVTKKSRKPCRSMRRRNAVSPKMRSLGVAKPAYFSFNNPADGGQLFLY